MMRLRYVTLPYGSSSLPWRFFALAALWLAQTALLFFPYLAPSPTVLASSSASFQVSNDQIGGSGGSQSSDNFQVIGGAESLVNDQSSDNFQAQSGSPLPIGASDAAPPSSGTTGLTTAPIGCPVPKAPTVTNVACSRVYKNLIKLTGARDRATPYIFVDENMAGVFFSSATTWSKDVYLVRGQNTITIYGKNACDAASPPITIVFTKANMGDTNDDASTNDYDLSTFTRRWERREDCITDFNQDKVTNDYDLSLLASAWTG